MSTMGVTPRVSFKSVEPPIARSASHRDAPGGVESKVLSPC
jgi:hypothetical protein